MKKLLSLMLVGGMLITALVGGAIPTETLQTKTVYAETNEIKVTVNGKLVVFDEKPIMEIGSVYVPMRAIFEALGYTVSWNTEFETVDAVLVDDYYLVSMSLGNGSNMLLTYKEFKKDYTKFEKGHITDRLPTECSTKFTNSTTFSPSYKVVNGRVLVPVRAISEGTGANVKWDSATKTVIIDNSNPSIKNVETGEIFDVNNAQKRVDTYFNNQVTTETNNTETSQVDKTSQEYRFPRGLATLDEHQQEVVRLINIEREKVGVDPLEIDPALMEIAQLKADEMIELDYFSHTSPNYGTAQQFAEHYGYTGKIGENIGRGSSYYVPSASVAMLMKSEEHKANMLNPNYKYVGVGRAGTLENGITVQIFSY